MLAAKAIQSLVTVKLEHKKIEEANELAKQSVAIVEKIIDKDNYLRAKALVHLSKALCGAKDIEEAEIVASQAKKEIINLLETDNHPLAAEFNQHLCEVLSARPESPERETLIAEVCTHNLETLINHFGETCVYTARSLFTLFTAKLSTELGGGDQMMAMTKLVVDEQPVRQNQFLYKAILINTIILMQAAPQDPSAQQRVEMQLKNCFA